MRSPCRMIVHIPSTVAELLSDCLWGLACPPDQRQGDTTKMFQWVQATDSTQWLVVDTEFSILVHPDAVLDGIADILQPWIDQGHLPADTNTNLAALVESLRGQRLTVYDAFPPLFKSMAKTREQMIADGLLPVPPNP